MRGQAVIHSSARVKEGGGSDSWGTPDNVLELVRKLGPIALDVASSAEANEHVRAKEFYDGSCDERDGLKATWATEYGVTFCNPPYSKMAAWSDAAIRYLGRGGHLVMLMPSRTDTRWWATLWLGMRAVCFVRGRLTFRDAADSPAPFPSALFYSGDAPHRFADVFGELGHVLVLR